MHTWRNFPGWRMMNFKGDLERLYEDIFGDAAENAEALGRLALRVDIEEDEKNFILTAEIPGVKKDEVKITFQEGRLTISGEKKGSADKAGKTFHRAERQFGPFCRSFNIPASILSAQISASFENGVLQINLPKTDEKKAKEIHIDVE